MHRYVYYARVSKADGSILERYRIQFERAFVLSGLRLVETLAAKCTRMAHFLSLNDYYSIVSYFTLCNRLSDRKEFTFY